MATARAVCIFNVHDGMTLNMVRLLHNTAARLVLAQPIALTATFYGINLEAEPRLVYAEHKRTTASIYLLRVTPCLMWLPFPTP